MLKRIIAKFWSDNVPGGEFYPRIKRVDEMRYKREPYLYEYIKWLSCEGGKLLEIGCGLGTDTRALAKAGMDVTALDASRSNVLKCIRGNMELGVKAKVILGDAENLKFEEEFDVIYSWGCLHHTPKTQKAINEIHKALKPNGKFMVMLYHKGYQWWYLMLKYMLYPLARNPQAFISKHYDQTPLSKMYSTRELKGMFYDFEDVKIEVIQYGAIMEHPILKYVWWLSEHSKWWKRNFGSFAVITGRKGDGWNIVA